MGRKSLNIENVGEASRSWMAVMLTRAYRLEMLGWWNIEPHWQVQEIWNLFPTASSCYSVAFSRNFAWYNLYISPCTLRMSPLSLFVNM